MPPGRLISVLIGRVSVSRLETDAITVVLFVVISLVVFIVPIAVYMEYRKKIEQLSARKSKRASSVTPSINGSSDKVQSIAEPEAACRFSFPPDFPDALKVSRMMAFIADSIATICNIRRQWKIFGDYWHLNNMRQLLDAKNRRGSKADKEDIVIGIFRKVAEADDSIRDTDAYRSWVRSVQN